MQDQVIDYPLISVEVKWSNASGSVLNATCTVPEDHINEVLWTFCFHPHLEPVASYFIVQIFLFFSFF